MSRDARFEEQAQALGYRFDGEIKIGGNYVPLVRDGHHIYLSGQIPRVGDVIELPPLSITIVEANDYRVDMVRIVKEQSVHDEDE